MTYLELMERHPGPWSRSPSQPQAVTVFDGTGRGVWDLPAACVILEAEVRRLQKDSDALAIQVGEAQSETLDLFKENAALRESRDRMAEALVREHVDDGMDALPLDTLNERVTEALRIVKEKGKVAE